MKINAKQEIGTIIPAYQIADYVWRDEVRWTIENIIVNYFPRQNKWEFYCIEWNELKEDYDCSEITEDQAKKYCDVEFPNVLYV